MKYIHTVRREMIKKMEEEKILIVSEMVEITSKVDS